MSLTDTQVHDLRKRLEDAAETLDGLGRYNPLQPNETGRLLGKAQGVRLALSYLDEYERGLLR